MSVITNPIKIPRNNSVSNYIISSSSPNEKLSMMMERMKLRETFYKDEEVLSKSSPACILTEYMSVYLSESDDDLIYSLDGSELGSEQGEKNNNIEDVDNSEVDYFDGDFTKDNPVINEMFENVSKYLLEREQNEANGDHLQVPLHELPLKRRGR